MSTAANAHVFSQPHWRVIAAGFDTERWFHDDQGIGTGGIANPQPTRLPSGQYYYRFASSNAARASQFGGGWWLDFETFLQLRGFAETNHYSLHEAARLMLALPYAWTRVDRLVRALLRQPLRAYTGLGKPAQGAGDTTQSADRNTRWIPTQHVALRQLYVPGLCVEVAGKPLYETVFSQPMEVHPLR